MTTVCDACNGTGVETYRPNCVAEPHRLPCWTCDGTGKLPPPDVKRSPPKQRTKAKA